MTVEEKPDDLLGALASLTAPAPAAARDARIRARCHAAMAHQRARVARPASGTLDDALAGGAVVYGIAVVAAVLRLAGLF